MSRNRNYLLDFLSEMRKADAANIQASFLPLGNTFLKTLGKEMRSHD